MSATQVFKTIADRFAERSEDIAVFAATGQSFESWACLEAFAACHDEGWLVTLHPAYGDVGLTGSRDTADLLVFDPQGGGRTIVELSVVHDFKTTRWIAELDRDTGILDRPLSNGTASLQLVLVVAPDSPIDHNPTWKGWLGMSSIWNRQSKLRRVTPVGAAGEVVLRGWVLGGTAAATR